MSVKKYIHWDLGFSIIELVIYSGLVAIVIGGSLGAVYQITTGSESLNRAIIREQEIRFVMDKVNWVLSDVSSVSSPLANASSTILTVSKPGFPQNPVSIQLIGSTVMIQQGTDPAIALHSDILLVSGIDFEYQVTTTTPNLVTIRLVVSGNEYKTQTYLQL